MASLKPSPDRTRVRFGPGRGHPWQERVLGEQLRLSLLGVPYNSFSPVLAAAGLSTPLVLGGNCIHQARVLGDLVGWRLPGSEVWYLVDGRHHAVVARCPEGETYYLDPYLGQLRAIRTPRWCGTVVVDAYPVIAGRLSRLQLTRAGPRVRVTKYVPRKSSTGLYRTHRFEYNWLSSARTSVPQDDDLEIAIHPEVTTLSIRVITRTGAMMSYVHSVTEQVRYVVTSALVRYQEGTPRFDATCRRISRLLGLDVQDLHAYGQQGITAYRHLTRGMGIRYVYPNAITGGIIHKQRRCPDATRRPAR